MRTIWFAVVCLTGAFGSVLPARGANAYAMACCTVPSSVSVIDRAAHRLVGTLIAGRGATFVALSPNGQTAYVINQDDMSVSVLDTVTGAQTGLIPLRSYNVHPFAAAISGNGARLYVIAEGSSLMVLGIDTATLTVQFNVKTPGGYNWYSSSKPVPAPVISKDGQTLYILGNELIAVNLTNLTVQTTSVGVTLAQGVAVTPDGAYVVETYNGGNIFFGEAGQLVLVDLNTRSVAKQISYPLNQTVGSVVLSPDGSLAYFPLNNSGSVTVEVFDIASRQIVNSFAAGSGYGNAMAITPDGSEIEMGEANATVVSIDTASGAVNAQMGVLGELASITLASDSSRIYVPNYKSSMVEIIDPATSQITGRIPAGYITGMYANPYTLQTSRDGRRAVVVTALNLAFIDNVTQHLIGAVPLNGYFESVALSPHGDRAYAVVSGQIVVIDTSSLMVTGVVTLTTTDQLYQSAVSPYGSTLYVGEQYCPVGGSCTPQLLAVNTASLTVTRRIPLSTADFYPGGIAITRDGTTAYVEGLLYSGGVSIVDLTQGSVVGTVVAQWAGPVLALSPDETLLYENAPTNYAYYVIDLATQVATGVPSGNGVYWEYETGMALSPDGRLVYVSSETVNYLQAFATNSSGIGTFLRTVNLPSATDGVAFSAR